jgi:hypothetical protein
MKQHETTGRSLGSLLRDIPKRFVELLIKLAGAKGLAFVAATLLLWFGKLDGWEWVAVASIFVATKAAEKLIGNIQVRGQG